MTALPRRLRRPYLETPVRVCVLLESKDVERAQQLTRRFGIPLSHQVREGLRMYQQKLGVLETHDVHKN
jgi:hypothetical protein